MFLKNKMSVVCIRCSGLTNKHIYSIQKYSKHVFICMGHGTPVQIRIQFYVLTALWQSDNTYGSLPCRPCMGHGHEWEWHASMHAWIDKHNGQCSNVIKCALLLTFTSTSRFISRLHRTSRRASRWLGHPYVILLRGHTDAHIFIHLYLFLGPTAETYWYWTGACLCIHARMSPQPLHAWVVGKDMLTLLRNILRSG